MKVLIFGASGMVGQGVLHECLQAADVDTVLALGLFELPQSHPKLQQLVHADLLDYAAVGERLRGFDACFFCFGGPAATDEAVYTRVNHDIPLAAATTLAALNPHMTFVYVSGAGTDGSAAMWARVKARTEQALLRLPFARMHMFRPGALLPLHVIDAKSAAWDPHYLALAPLMRRSPRNVLTTAEVGAAMLETARAGAPKPLLESADIHALAHRHP